MSFVDARLKDLREVRDSVSGQASQHDELEKHLCKFAIKDKRDHVVSLTDFCRSLELPTATSRGGMSKAEYVQQILTALLAALPATASVDDGKTALKDAFRDSSTGQLSQRRQLESRLEQFNAASVDASLQELRRRRVRDGLSEQAAQRCELEKCLADIKMKDQGGDAVVLTDLCRSLVFPLQSPVVVG